MSNIRRTMCALIILVPCLTMLSPNFVSPASAEGSPYYQYRDARVYSFAGYFGRAFSHTGPLDIPCGTYALLLGAHAAINTNYGGVPGNWVATLNGAPLAISVFSGSMRVGSFNAWSPMGYMEDYGFYNVYVPAGIRTNLAFDAFDPFAIPVTASFDNYLSVQTYSGPSITYAAGRTDYMRPFRDYSSPPFTDIPTSSPESYPTSVLYSLGITFGIGGGLYAPTQSVPRWQMASFIARAMGWQYEEWWDYNFTDIGGLNYETQRHIRALAHYGVTRGYDAAGCAALGKAHPCFVPEANISYVQTLAFISRANVAKGYWYWFPANSSLYPDVPSVHWQDVTAYVYNSSEAPDTTVFANWPWSTSATNRGWYGRALWQSLP